MTNREREIITARNVSIDMVAIFKAVILLNANVLASKNLYKLWQFLGNIYHIASHLDTTNQSVGFFFFNSYNWNVKKKNYVAKKRFL